VRQSECVVSRSARGHFTDIRHPVSGDALRGISADKFRGQGSADLPTLEERGVRVRGREPAL